MPFLADVSKSIETDVDFAPPLDIHWVWHVHMLAPVSYKMDCINVAGRLLGHRLTNSLERDALREKTRKVWVKHFPNEPFDLAESKRKNHQEFPNGLVSKIAYNIEEAASRQRVFYYQVSSINNAKFCYAFLQVSLPHYSDPEFHADSVRRYRMYLHLKKKNTKTFLVPCYDMDLVWHAHQVQNLRYYG